MIPTEVKVGGWRMYLAAPLFTVAERAFNEEIACHLRWFGHLVFLPQDTPQKYEPAIFNKNVIGLKWSNTIVAILDGSDPDSGTAWECGYAFATERPVIGVRTDFRSADLNLMLTQSVHKMIVAPDQPGFAVAKLIDRALREIELPALAKTTKEAVKACIHCGQTNHCGHGAINCRFMGRNM